MNPEAELYPIAILIDELRHEDVSLRLNAIKRLNTIALALGPQRARDELIPFLDESVDDEDEVLLELAGELGDFVEYIGGAQFAHILLQPLENLAAVEETMVRDKAVESLNKICPVLSQTQLEQYYIPLVKRLTHGDWFTSRTSAAGLYANGYSLAALATQEDMRKSFSQLCMDDTPMVRRAAATHLGTFAKKVSKEHLISDIIPLCNRLAQDEQDSVRLLTVTDLVAIAEELSPDECKTYILQALKAMVTDKSWRVRYMVADNFVKLSVAVGQDITREELVVAFVRLLKDSEAEVRTAAAGQVPGFAQLVDTETILNHILPCVRELVTDTSQHVRAAVAMQISGLAPILGKEATTEHLLPLFLQLLKDEFPDVRLNIISKLETVNNVIGIELLSQSLLPAIVELAEDKQWRVRLAIIDYIPLLATQLGVEFFDEKLGALCMSWLGDSVFSIREAATVNLRKLAEVFGVDWAKQTIIPKVLAMGTHPNYLYRMTTIFAITAMASAVTPEVIRDYILPTVINLVSDPIPNIRFNVAKSIEAIIPVLMQNPDTKLLVEQQLKPGLVKLSEDTDNDVRFFAQKALLIVQFVADGVFYAELNEFFQRELAAEGYSGVEVRVTPARTEIIIRATQTQEILGVQGRRIRELTSLVQKRFKFPENTVELYAEKVSFRGLCAIAQCESLKYKLLNGVAVRRACYGVVRYIMESGAKGCEVVVSGKLRGARAKAMKFVDGFMIHSGQPTKDFVDTAVRHVLLRQGVLGVRVKIMLPWDPQGKMGPKTPLPDMVTIMEPKEEIPILAPVSESREEVAAPVAVAPVEA
ncbi:40S ribosomal protein S3 [Haplosporangium sp. Z 11]|nr:40S ribosomal protein S3 [Haplosporangium sp. Z 11]